MATMQTTAVLEALRELGHATNLTLFAVLHPTMPTLSVQAVHRITSRLLERGEIGLAPSDGRQMMLDANPHTHDHFACTSCGGLIDIQIPESTIDAIQARLGRNLVRDGIVVNGRCESCAEAELDDELSDSSMRMETLS